MMSQEIDLSVVISCYYEEKSIDEFHRRLLATLKKINCRFEIIYVNDGSKDATFEKLENIYEQDKEVTAVIDLFGNVGQANAKTPGLPEATGNALVLIDSDLQLDPEELTILVEKYREGFDLVSGVRKKRQDSLLRIIPSRIANSLMRKASKSQLTDFGCTFKIYNMKLVRGFDFDRFNPWRMLPVVSHASRIAEVGVTHHPRKYGKSGWTLQKLFAYNMETIVNLSERPFQYIAILFALLTLVLVARVIIGISFPGSILKATSNGLILNAVAISFLSTLAVLSLIGEFVIRIFSSSQKKPAYIIRTIHRRERSSQ